jgi:hypothetical protein
MNRARYFKECAAELDRIPGLTKAIRSSNGSTEDVLLLRTRLPVLRRCRGADGAGAGREGAAGLRATATAGGATGKPIAEFGALLELFGETSFEVFGGKLRRKTHSGISPYRLPGIVDESQQNREVRKRNIW